MSERERALHALAGRHFPRVGDRALYITEDRSADPHVEVVRISPSGQTIWTRFVSADGQLRHGGGIKLHRWSRNRVYDEAYDSVAGSSPPGLLWFSP